MKYNRVLTIAGSDSGGGAGIQADIKTISACGCYAASVITAITAQNTREVVAVEPVSVDMVELQIEAVMEDIGVDAVKIGMLHSPEVIIAVANMLKKYDVKNVVLDPVMISTSGHPLIEDGGISALIKNLMPLARVITPNIPEAELLLKGKRIYRQSDMPAAAIQLAETMETSVLLKAGHLTEDNLVDIFYDNENKKIYELPSERLYTKNTHGTGCTMSSAFASYLAKGLELHDAAAEAKKYINNAIIAGADYDIGHGFGPVKHFFDLWKE